LTEIFFLILTRITKYIPPNPELVAPSGPHRSGSIDRAIFRIAAQPQGRQM